MGQITLQILDGVDRGKIYRNIPTPVTIGREEGNLIQLNDERISRLHLKIQEDRWEVKGHVFLFEKDPFRFRPT